MREQVITPRANRSASGVGLRTGGVAQRPTARRGSKSSQQSGAWSKIRSAAPLIAKILLLVCCFVIIFAGYRAAASASFFQAQTIDVRGAAHASTDEIRAVVRRATTQTGVWHTDVAQISDELKRQPWVRTAVVSRVLPAGLRVRITERTRLAVIRTSHGRLVWVDEEGIMLNALSPADHLPPFFVRGWNEANTEAASRENRERIAKYRQMLREWESFNLLDRVSEVNLSDVRDVRAQLAGDDSQIEVRLGGNDFGNRLVRALKAMNEASKTLNGATITRLDATLDQRTIVGFSSGAQEAGSDTAGNSVSSTAPAQTSIRNRDVNRQEAKKRVEQKRAEAQENKNAQRKDVKQEKRNRARDSETTRRDVLRQERPRRTTR